MATRSKYDWPSKGRGKIKVGQGLDKTKLDKKRVYRITRKPLLLLEPAGGIEPPTY